MDLVSRGRRILVRERPCRELARAEKIGPRTHCGKDARMCVVEARAQMRIGVRRENEGGPAAARRVQAAAGM